MSVQRFRSVAEMNAAPLLTRTGEGFERFLRHCARYWALAPPPIRGASSSSARSRRRKPRAPRSRRAGRVDEDVKRMLRARRREPDQRRQA